MSDGNAVLNTTGLVRVNFLFTFKVLCIKL